MIIDRRGDVRDHRTVNDRCQDRHQRAAKRTDFPEIHDDRRYEHARRDHQEGGDAPTNLLLPLFSLQRTALLK